MKEEKMKKITDLLIRLKKISEVYRVATYEQQGRLLKNSQFIIDDLIGMGYKREFVETLLIGGKDFLESLFGEGDLFTEKRPVISVDETARIIFGR